LFEHDLFGKPAFACFESDLKLGLILDVLIG